MEVNEPVLRIWTENNGLISSDAFYTEMIDKQVNLLMELIEKEFPISVSALDAVRDILKIQLEGLLWASKVIVFPFRFIGAAGYWQ